jgi:hypothetical protein
MTAGDGSKRVALGSVETIAALVTVAGFVEHRSWGWWAVAAPVLLVLLAAVALLRSWPRDPTRPPRTRLLALSICGLVAGAAGVAAVAAVQLRDPAAAAPPAAAVPAPAAVPDFSTEGVSLDQRARVPRCNAVISGVAPAGDEPVWVAHTDATKNRYFFTPAERTDRGAGTWTANLIVGGDPGPDGTTVDGPVYEFIAFVASAEGNDFLSKRGYAVEGSATGLVYFDALPPGVTVVNQMTATREAGPGGACPVP